MSNSKVPPSVAGINDAPPQVPPAELTRLNQWVVWQFEKRDGRQTKVPYSVYGNLASTTDPGTWESYEYANGVCNCDGYRGVGFVFSGDDPYTGIDFDDCLEPDPDDRHNADPGARRLLKKWARPLLEPFCGTYAEISPSGRGIKVWCRAKLPGSGKKAYIDNRTGLPNRAIKSANDKNYAGGIEMYDRGRFFTVTERTYDGAPGRIEDRQEEADRLYALITGTAKRGDAGIPPDRQQSHHGPEKAKFSPDEGAKSENGKIPQGQRHNTLVSLAGTMRKRGMSAEAIESALQAENAARCVPPYDRDHVRKIAESAAEWEPGANGSSARTSTLPAERPWPAPLTVAPYQGIAGDLIQMIEPRTEADPPALFVQFLVLFGNLVGRHAYVLAGSPRQYTNMFAVICGESNDGRKGEALHAVLNPLAELDSAWWPNRKASGLGSGEGIIERVRDACEQEITDKKGQTRTIVRPGMKDKRLMAVATEFASILKVMERQGSTLSPVIRDCWDSGDLEITVRHNPVRATDAHVSLLAHVTPNEVRRLLTATESANGFGNRFVWCCSTASKLLPEGGRMHTVDFSPILRRLENAVRFGRTCGELDFDVPAQDIWGRNENPDVGVYHDLRVKRSGLAGEILSRAPSHVKRLALIYAILDCAPAIGVRHLTAALGLWRYCEQSAVYIFGDLTGDATADAILTALRQSGAAGMTRTDLYHMFDRNKPSEEITRALHVLENEGKARCVKEPTEGRPTERWFAV